ncbi:MAG: ATP-binding protein [Myxococcales bacterium]|nr:ATP-binding protein [Myxococcales bacterium]
MPKLGPRDKQPALVLGRRLARLRLVDEALPLSLCDALSDDTSLGAIGRAGLSMDQLDALRFMLSRPRSARRPLHPGLPLGTRGERLLVADYRGKDQAVLQLGAWGQAQGLSRRSAEGLEQAVDELLLNALFDAPCDQAGRPRYVGLSPRERLSITAPPGEAAEVRFAADGRRVVVAVRDGFGALRRTTVLRYFRRCALAQQARLSPLEQKAGGSGVGLYLVLGTASELFFRLRSGVSTEVVYTVYRDRPWSLRALLIEDDSSRGRLPT